MRRRRGGERCINCGGTTMVDCIDNHGQPYRGCPRCIVGPAPGGVRVKPGDTCRLRVHEKWRSDGPREVDAVVHMVNAEGQPAAFAVDAIIEGFVHWLPVLWRDGKAYTFLGTLVDVEVP